MMNKTHSQRTFQRGKSFERVQYSCLGFEDIIYEQLLGVSLFFSSLALIAERSLYRLQSNFYYTLIYCRNATLLRVGRKVQKIRCIVQCVLMQYLIVYSTISTHTVMP